MGAKLEADGHDVTYAGAYPLTGKDLKVTQFNIGQSCRDWCDHSSQLLFVGAGHEETDLFGASMSTNDEALVELKKLDKKFDLVMVHPAFGNEVGLYIAWLHGAAIALYLSDMFTTATYLNHAFGSYPGMESEEPIRDDSVQKGVLELVRKHYPNEEEILSKSIEDIESTAQLILGVGSPMVMSGMRPCPPNTVYCGMLQCRPPLLLPEDLQKFMDEAAEGVIFVSFGSVLPGSKIPQDKLEALCKAFGKLKQKVLWKWETDTMPNKPENVTLHKFLPQQDVLGHPNLQAFVTHAGYLSIEEAFAHKVPMVTLPIVYDAFDNSAEAERLGVGVNIKFTEITEEKLESALEKVLHDPSYKNNAEALGEVIAPWKEMVGPVERVAWWMNHVTDNKKMYSFK